MEGSKGKKTLCHLVALLFCFSFGLSNLVPALAQTQEIGFKADLPKLDSSLPDETKLKVKSKSGNRLQGGVEHRSKIKPSGSARLIPGRARSDGGTLKARAKDDSLQSQAQASIGIVGVKFVSTVGRAPVINEVFPGTPAADVGLRVYDVIVAVDGVPTLGLTKDEIFDLIVGSPGTPVNLSIMRNGDYSVVNCTRMDITELTDARVRRDYLIHM